MTRWLPSLPRPGPKSALLTALCLLALLAACAPAAEPAQEPESTAYETFTDILEHPMEFEILDGLERGFYTVPSDGRFRPDEPATCGEFLSALWNLSGRPGDAQSAIDWAAGAGYIDGASFQPDALITRQEAMSILYAHNGSVSGVETMLTGIYDSGFRDSTEIPPGGKTALYWGFYNVLIREPEPDIISPSGTVSRGDMAYILIRYADAFRSESPEN